MPKPSDSTAKGLPRSYLFKVAPELNTGKEAALDALQAEWSRVLPLAFDWYWKPFLKGGLLPRNTVRSGPASTFPSTSFGTATRDLMAVAIQGQAASWASNLKNRIAKSCMRDDVLAEDEAFRREILWINRCRAWLLPYKDQLALLESQPPSDNKLQSLSLSASRIARRMVRNYLSRKRLPNPKNLPLQVNQLNSVWANAHASKAPWARHWLRISTLERNQRIELPVMANPFAERKKEEQTMTFSLMKRETGWYVIAVKRRQATPWPTFKTAAIGVDLGLRTLMSTSSGDLIGRNFIKSLQSYDAQIQRIQKGLQEAGEFRLARCKRYRKVIAQFRGWLKTKIGQYLNQLLELRRPGKVIIEELFFQETSEKLSRRMHRLVRNFGQQVFNELLDRRSEEFGFTVERINPAYTSQQCAHCGFVHADNRKGDKFVCLSCGHRAHADVNAAKNMLRRSERKATFAYCGPATVWDKSLEDWVVRQRAALVDRDASCLPKNQRAVGCTRAGARALVQRKSSAAKLSPELKQLLQTAATAPVSELLSSGLDVENWPLKRNLKKRVSTRYSG